MKVKASRDLMHLKSYVIDGALLRTGSANWSPTGLKRQDNDLQYEADPALAKQFEARFAEMWDRPGNFCAISRPIGSGERSTECVCVFAFSSPILLLMGHMARAEAREEQARLNAKFTSTLVIAAAIIVAVRLAREDIALPTPRLISSVGHSISLARTILKEVLRRYPGA